MLTGGQFHNVILETRARVIRDRQERCVLYGTIPDKRQGAFGDDERGERLP